MKQRSVAELIGLALSGDEEDALAWDAIREVHRRGEPAYEAASSLLRSAFPKERARAADLLAQLGSPCPSEALRARCAAALLEALRSEVDPTVLAAMGSAFGHLGDARAIPAFVALVDHPDERVRFGAVMALIPHPDEAAVQALIKLSTDPDEDTRNWATFGLGSQLDGVDTPALRDALVARLSDLHDETRGEALVGLAVRRDLRVLDALRAELGKKRVIVLAVEAAQRLGEVSLLPLLIDLRDAEGDAGDYFRNVLRDAIKTLEAQSR